MYKIMISFLLLFLIIGSVNANDDNSTLDNLTSDNNLNNNVIGVDNDEPVNTGESVDIFNEYDYEIDIDFPDEITAGESYGVSINLPEDASGEIQVYVDDEFYDESTVDGGYAYSNIYFSKLGNHSVEYKYGGDENYVSSSKLFNFEITEYIIDIEYYNLEFGKTNEIYINLPSSVSGTITVIINGKQETYDLEYESEIYVSSDNFKYGNNEITVKFSGYDDFYPLETKEIIELNSFINFNSTIAFDEECAISLKLPGDAKGNLIVNIDGEIQKIKLNDGFAQYLVSNLSLGHHSLNMLYDGNDYNVESEESSIEVIPKINSFNQVYVDGDNIVSIELPEGVNGVFTVYINDDEFDSILIENSKASVKLPRLTEEFELGIYYNGEVDYETVYYVHVNENSPEFEWNVTVFDALYGSDFHYEINLPDHVNGNVLIYIDDILYDEYVNLTLGQHTLKAVFQDDYYKSDVKVIPFEVSYLIISIPENVIINNYDNIGFSFINGLQGQIDIFIDNELYNEFILTPAFYGDHYSVDLSELALGYHEIEVKYSGDDKYEPIIKKAVINLDYNISFYYFEYPTDKYLELSLPQDIQLENLEIKINGIKYDINHGVRGNLIYDYDFVNISDLTIGEYKLQIIYRGDEKYSSKEFNYEFNIVPQIRISDDIVYNGNASISLSLPKNANGNLIVNLNDKLFKNQSLINGFTNISLNGILPGEYKLNVNYDGDDYIIEALTDEYLYIRHNIDYKEYMLVNETQFVSIELPNNALGDVQVILDGELFTQSSLTDGKLNISLGKMKLGEHTINLIYTGDNYNLDEELSVYVYPIDERYQVFYDDIIYMVLPDDAKGKLILLKDDVEYASSNFINGYASIKFNFELGWLENYSIKYDGDDYGPYYSELEGIIKPKVLIYDGIEYQRAPITPVAGALAWNYINISANNQLIFELPNEYNGELIMTTNDVFYEKTSLTNGKVNISLKNLKLGHQIIYIDYEYAKDAHDFVAFFVYVKNTPEINIDVNDTEVGNNTKININIPDAKGDVTVKINDKNYSFKLEKNNISLNIPELTIGTYNVTVQYYGDENNLKGIASKVFNVVNIPQETNESFNNFTEISNQTLNNTEFEINIIASNLIMQYYDGSVYKVRVFGSDGNPSSNVKVTIKLDSKKYKTLTTDKNGYASFKITNTPKTYKISINALGKTITKKITVKQVLKIKTTAVKKSAKKVVLTATLTKVKGKYLKNKKITFKFNGKKYTAKTNKKGIAKVSIKNSILKKLKVGKKINYQATYVKNTVKKSIKVKK